MLVKSNSNNSLGRRAVRLMALVVIAAIPLAPVGCRNDRTSLPSNHWVVTDDLGRRVKVAREIRRIVSLSPCSTETVCALGCYERLVGRDTASDYPEKVKKLPTMGEWGTPDMEAIVAAKPDLIIGASETIPVATVDDLQKKTGAPIFIQKPDSLIAVLRNIQQVGELTGTRGAAKQSADRIRKIVAMVDNKVGHVLPRTVFMEIWNAPLITVGGDTLLNEMMERAGGHNIAADLKQPFPNYSLEALLAADPEVYIVPRGRAMGIAGEIGMRPHFDKLQAVKRKRVISVPNDPIFRPGPRIGEGVELLARAIHPEAFR